MAQDRTKAQRRVITHPGGSMDTLVGGDALERFGADAKALAGTPRKAALLCGACAPAAFVDEIKRQLADAGFERVDLATPAEPLDTVDNALPLYAQLSAAGITADDVLVAVGDASMVRLACYVAGQWCGGSFLMVVPTDFEAALEATAPGALGVGDAAGLVAAGAWPRKMHLASDDLALSQTPAQKARFGAVLAQLSMVDKRATNALTEETLTKVLAGDREALVTLLLPVLSTRGQVATSANPAVSAALRYGTVFAEALASLPGVDLAPADLLGEGLRFEARVACGLGKLAVDAVFAQDALLDRLGVPELALSADADELLAALHSCARRTRNRFQMALPLEVGTVRLSPVDDAMLREHVVAWCASRARLAQ